MKKLLLLLLCSAALAASALPASAARDRAQNRVNISNLKALRKNLDLSDDQVARIRTEFAQHKDTLHAGTAKLHEARAHLRELIQANAPETEIRAAAANVGAAEGDLAVARAALFVSIKPILTPEQLAKLKTLEPAGR